MTVEKFSSLAFLNSYLNAVWDIFEKNFYFCEEEKRKWQKAAAEKTNAGEHQTLFIKENLMLRLVPK